MHDAGVAQSFTFLPREPMWLAKIKRTINTFFLYFRKRVKKKKVLNITVTYNNMIFPIIQIAHSKKKYVIGCT